MAYDYERTHEHEHELDAEYLYRSDTEVLSIHGEDDSLIVLVAVPCPECGETLELKATVDEVTESEIDLPLEDVEDRYD